MLNFRSVLEASSCSILVETAQVSFSFYTYNYDHSPMFYGDFFISSPPLYKCYISQKVRCEVFIVIISMMIMVLQRLHVE
jgi:hypothetical protein